MKTIKIIIITAALVILLSFQSQGVLAYDPINLCVPASVVSCSQMVSGNNSAPGSTDQIDSYSCAGWDESGPEYTYTFVPDISGIAVVSLSHLSADLDVFVLDDPEGSCDSNNCIALGDARAEFPITAGEAYYILVDGYAGATGDYTLSVGCGEKFTGNHEGAEYDIYVPENWNGTLLVRARGGGLDKNAACTPDVTQYSVDGGQYGDFRGTLLGQGYALASSGYRECAGWSIKDGIRDTKNLTTYFNGLIGIPDRVILYGNSKGASITFKSIEQYPGIYDGAISLCHPGAGATKNADLLLAFGLSYDVTFGWPSSWGSVWEVREDLDWQTDVWPVLVSQLINPNNIGKFEFIRLVNDLPLDGFYTSPYWIIYQMQLTTMRGWGIDAYAGGPGYQNIDHVYSLSANEKAYLASLGVNADELLDEMNARTIYEAEPNARNYLEQYADFSGNLTRPVLTLSNKRDGAAIIANSSVYYDTVLAAGKEDLLVQTYTDNLEHCSFTTDQWLSMFNAMESWLDTGVPPDQSYFPEALGFDNNYVPPPWPHLP